MLMRRPDDSSHEVSEPDVGSIVGVPREVLIGELLGLCDGFFRSAGPVVRTELLTFLVTRACIRPRPWGGSSTR